MIITNNCNYLQTGPWDRLKFCYCSAIALYYVCAAMLPYYYFCSYAAYVNVQNWTQRFIYIQPDAEKNEEIKCLK